MSDKQQEEVIWEGSQSQVLNFGIFISMGIVFVVVMALSLLFFLPAAVLGIIPLVYIFVKWLVVKNQKYKITTERIFYTTGIFSKKTEAMELYRVKDVDMYEPFWQRMFKLGNISLSSSDQTTANFLLKAVPKPAELMNSIRKSVETRRDVKRVRGIEVLGDEESIENL